MIDTRTNGWGVRVGVLLAIVGQIACGETENTTEPILEDKGDLTLLVSGDDISHTLTGKAVFGTARTSSGADEWVLFLWRGDQLRYQSQFDVLDMFRASLDRPEPGTYTMAAFSDGARADQEFAGRYIFSFGISYGVFHVESGTLTIETSSDQEISGSFEMTAVIDERFSTEVSADTAMVSGTFRAAPGVIPILN